MSTTTAAPPGLRLHKLEIENFLKVRALQIDARGNHVVVTGPNTCGKSSTINAIWAALGGVTSKEMPEPVHRGSDRAKVILDLGDFIVERHWTEKSTRLVIRARDGSTVARPQQLLDGLLGKYGLDPVAFLGRRPQDQVDDVLQICEVLPPVKAVREIVGPAEPVEPRAGESACTYLERLSADETGAFYVRRREAHRIETQKLAALEDQRQTVAALSPATSADPGPDAETIMNQLQRLNAEASSWQTAKGLADDSQRELAECKRLMAARLQEEKKLEAEITQMRAALAAKEHELEVVRSRVAKGESVIAAVDSKLSAHSSALGTMTDPQPAIAACQLELAAISKENEAVTRRKVAAETLEKLAKELETASREHERLEGVLEKLRELRRHLLDGVDLGVPGLEIGQGELRLNGVSFRQASQAEQIRVACAVAMRQNPALKLLRIDNGEHLDRNSRELVLQLADQHGWQVIYTAVADQDQLRVEIVEHAEAADGGAERPSLLPITGNGALFADLTAGPHGERF